jgi:hypothetical protein
MIQNGRKQRCHVDDPSFLRLRRGQRFPSELQIQEVEIQDVEIIETSMLSTGKRNGSKWKTVKTTDCEVDGRGRTAQAIWRIPVTASGRYRYSETATHS